MPRGKQLTLLVAFALAGCGSSERHDDLYTDVNVVGVDSGPPATGDRQRSSFTECNDSCRADGQSSWGS